MRLPGGAVAVSASARRLVGCRKVDWDCMHSLVGLAGVRDLSWSAGCAAAQGVGHCATMDVTFLEGGEMGHAGIVALLHYALAASPTVYHAARAGSRDGWPSADASWRGPAPVYLAPLRQHHLLPHRHHHRRRLPSCPQSRPGLCARAPRHTASH